ncbi:MAG: hypothetical protein NC489_41795 [Ruminococcus flavefaciens]|nr:hypothetical protein [Ruminococcus flavefaciens]
MSDVKKDEELLELYDGQMALANRKLVSANVTELKYTAAGKELFALSESVYGKWLEEGGNLKLVDKAIELCGMAVALGYPHAVVKMAFYYDKDYIAVDRTEEFRCRVACDYYSQVVYREKPPRIEEGVTPEISWEELQRQASRMFLDMLAGSSELQKYSDGKYSYAFNCNRIKELYGITPDKDAVKRSERDGAELARKIFFASKHNKLRAPLFGVFSLTKDEAKQAFSPRAQAMKVCGDINIWLKSGEKIIKVNTTAAFTKFLSSIETQSIWVYYCNNNLGGHRYLSARQRKDLCELLMKDDFMRFSRLEASAKERGRSEYLFSDDDVYFFMTGLLPSIRGALDALLDKAVNDKEWSEL